MYSKKLQFITFQWEFSFTFKPTGKKVWLAEHEEINIPEYSDNEWSLGEIPFVRNLF